MALAPQTRFRALFWVVAVLGLVVVGLQFVRPELTNPPVTAELQAPPEVKAVFRELLLQLPLK
jgi:hypothetical protein